MEPIFRNARPPDPASDDAPQDGGCGIGVATAPDDVANRRSIVLWMREPRVQDHGDRVAYANSVEVRYPFLDIQLLELAKIIPPELKLHRLVEKYILKQVAAKYLPSQIINREKFGFVAPGSPYLLKRDIAWLNDILSYERIKRQGYFDADTVERLKKIYLGEHFRLNLPFENDLLMIIITFGVFLDVFEMPAFG